MQLPHQAYSPTPRFESELFRAPVANGSWVDVCALSDVLPGTGVAILLDGHQIAVVRGSDGCTLYAISNYDPFSHAFVIARGIVGSRAGVPKIASPIFKQNFHLETGQCLDDPSVRLPVYPVRASGDRVEVSLGGANSR
jgi:nitrite reductase (NADH) small subunit